MFDRTRVRISLRPGIIDALSNDLEAASTRWVSFWLERRLTREERQAKETSILTVEVIVEGTRWSDDGDELAGRVKTLEAFENLLVALRLAAIDHEAGVSHPRPEANPEAWQVRR